MNEPMNSRATLQAVAVLYIRDTGKGLHGSRPPCGRPTRPAKVWIYLTTSSLWRTFIWFPPVTCNRLGPQVLTVVKGSASGITQVSLMIAEFGFKRFVTRWSFSRCVMLGHLGTNGCTVGQHCQLILTLVYLILAQHRKTHRLICHMPRFLKLGDFCPI